MTLYSIGHSNAEIGEFVDLLLLHGVQILVDARSQPYSRYSPHFNREPLKKAVSDAQVEYAYMGDALGGRPEASEYYFDSGKVDYDRLARAPFYLAGIDRLLEIGATRRVAFFCSEADFKKCHRYWLITRTLAGRGVEVKHITHSGELASSDVSDFQPSQLSLFQ